MEPMPKKSKLELNEFLFLVVNQFNLDEFTRYTNFRDVMLTILTDRSNIKDLERYIRQNFEKNIPNEELWLRGGFYSLKLTEAFYESDTAARVFETVFGIKKCSVTLDRFFGFESPKVVMKRYNNAANVLDVQHTAHASHNQIDQTKTPHLDSSSNENLFVWKLKYPKKIPFKSHQIKYHNKATAASLESAVQYPQSNRYIDNSVNFQQNTKQIPTFRQTEETKENQLIRLPLEQSKLNGTEIRNSRVNSSSEEIQTFEQLSSSTSKAAKDTTVNHEPVNHGNAAVLQSEKSRQSKVKISTIAKQGQAIPSDQTLSGNDVHPRNIVEKSQATPSDLITVSVPFDVIKGHMNKSEIEDNFRRSFSNELKYFEKEFEKYLTWTDTSNLSLNDFWHTLFGSKISNDKKKTQTTNGIVNTFGYKRPHHEIHEIEINQEIILDDDDVGEQTSDGKNICVSNYPKDILASTRDITNGISDNSQSRHNDQSSMATFPKPQQSIVELRTESSTAAAGCSKGFQFIIPQKKNPTRIHQPVKIVLDQLQSPNIRSVVRIDTVTQPSASQLSNYKRKTEIDRHHTEVSGLTKQSAEIDVNFPPNKRSAESYVSEYQQEFCNFLKRAPSGTRQNE